MSTLTQAQINEITRFSDVISKSLRDNFTNVKNAINDNQLQINNLIIDSGTSDAETIAARDNAATLKDNIHLRSLFGDAIENSTFVVTQQTIADDTVKVTAGNAIINGIGIQTTTTLNSPAIAASTAGNHRIVVIVVETDNTIDVVASAEVLTSLIATYPTIADTQKSLASILIDDTGPVVINNADITDLRFKGATVNGKYFFVPQDAIDDLDDNIGGDIVIGSGDYLGENMDITSKSNIKLIINTGARFFRSNSGDITLKSNNVVSAETNNNTIIGGEFLGNGQTGSDPMVLIAFTDNFKWIDTSMDGNASATATFKNYTIDDCDNFMLQGLKSSALDFNIINSLNWTSQTDNDFVQDNFSLQDMAEILSRNSNF